MGLLVKGRPKCTVTFQISCFFFFILLPTLVVNGLFIYFSIENKHHISYLDIKFYKL
jgi:hypothetical protein